MRAIGLLRNHLLLSGTVFELAVAALLVCVPALQDVFGHAVPDLDQIAVVLPFPFVIWGADELRKLLVRRTGRGRYADAGAVRG